MPLGPRFTKEFSVQPVHAWVLVAGSIFRYITACCPLATDAAGSALRLRPRGIETFASPRPCAGAPSAVSSICEHEMMIWMMHWHSNVSTAMSSASLIKRQLKPRRWHWQWLPGSWGHRNDSSRLPSASALRLPVSAGVHRQRYLTPICETASTDTPSYSSP